MYEGNKRKLIRETVNKRDRFGLCHCCLVHFVNRKLKADVTRDDSQRRFKARHSVATLLRTNGQDIATLCCAKKSSLRIVPCNITLGNTDDECYENVTWKVNSRYFKLYRTYSNSFKSSNVGNFFWSWILEDVSKFRRRKGESVHVHDTTWNCSRTATAKKCTKKSDARAKLLFIFTIRFNVLQVCLSVSPFANSLCYS